MEARAGRRSVPRYQTNHDRTVRIARTFWDKIWHDDAGRTVIYQRPNIWIIGWALFDLAAIFVPSKTIAGVLWAAGAAFLVIWALLELARGVNYFRRALGLIVLLMTVGSIFKIGL